MGDPKPAVRANKLSAESAIRPAVSLGRWPCTIWAPGARTETVVHHVVRRVEVTGLGSTEQTPPNRLERKLMTIDASPTPLIVVGVDGSAESLKAVDWAVAYAKATGGTLELLTTWARPLSYGLPLE